MSSIQGRPRRPPRALPVVTRTVVGAALLLLFTTRCDAVRDVTLFDGREVRANEVLVKFGPPLKALDIELIAPAVKEMTNGRVEIERVGGLDVFRVTSTDLNVAALMELFNRHTSSGFVEYVEPNQVLYLDAPPDDPLFGNLWGLSNKGQDLKQCGDSSPPPVAGSNNADTDAVEAWEFVGGTDVVVAVLDTGVDLTHEDLKDALWTAQTDFTVVFYKNNHREEIKCPAGTHGFNFLAEARGSADVDPRCLPTDDFGHGTEVAGVIAAIAGNHAGGAGVAGNRTDESGRLTARVKLMPIKIANSTGKLDVAKVADAIEFVRQVNQQGLANVRVLNNSYGFLCNDKRCLNPPIECSPPTLEAAVGQTEGLNLLFVASAGKGGLNNDCILHYPSSYLFPNVVAVAASDNQDKLDYDESNYGPTRVHIAAPGISICTTALNSRYVYAKGTSLSTAFVSGAAALVLSRCGRRPSELKEQLINSTDPVKFDDGKPIARGRLNVLRAVQRCGT